MTDAERAEAAVIQLEMLALTDQLCPRHKNDMGPARGLAEVVALLRPIFAKEKAGLSAMGEERSA